MNGRSALLLSFLVYLALDLSLVVMPGAFVFDPGACVDGVHGARARIGGDLADAPGVAAAAAAIVPPRPESTEPPRRLGTVERLRHPVVSWLPCLPRGCSSLPEDPF